MTVDRSNSDYETIRNYQDRGMMKWGAFATGELSVAQKTKKSEQLKVSSNKTQSNDEILQALVYSWTHKETVTIAFKEGKEEKNLLVKLWILLIKRALDSVRAKNSTRYIFQMSKVYFVINFNWDDEISLTRVHCILRLCLYLFRYRLSYIRYNIIILK